MSGIYGVGYKIGLEDNGTTRLLRLAFTYAESSSAQDGFLAFPRTWSSPVPSTEGFRPQRYGTAETQGIFGGIENKYQELISEIGERLIGEALTVSLCSIVDTKDMAFTGSHDEKGTLVAIFGPALPKVVGRLASLRLPESVKVVWLCPENLPSWITGEATNSLILPYYPPFGSNTFAEGWEDEPLIQGFKYRLQGQDRNFSVQYLDLYGLGDLAEVQALLDRYEWVNLRRIVDRCALNIEGCFQSPDPSLGDQALLNVSKLFPDEFLPREMAVAVMTVDSHLGDPYKAGIEKPPLRTPEPALFNGEPGREGNGWVINWAYTTSPRNEDMDSCIIRGGEPSL